MMVIYCGLAILRYVLACVIRKEPLSPLLRQPSGFQVIAGAAG